MNHDKVKCLEWYKPMLKVAKQVGIKGKVALDVGCGHGYVAGYLRAKGAEVLALDIDPAVLKEQSIKSYFIRGMLSIFLLGIRLLILS